MANTDLATRHDLDLLRTELRVDMAELRGEMGELRGEVRSEIGEVRAEIRTAVADLRTTIYRRVLPMIGAIVTAVLGIGLTILGTLRR